MINTNQNGRSMIEMLGVLAIIGVLSVGGIAGYSKAMEKMKINKTMQQISTIAANVHTLYAGQGNYEGLDTNVAYNAGIIPDEMWKYGAAHNVWGERVEVREISLWDYKNPKEFYISMKLSSDFACTAILSHDWGVAGENVILNVYTEGVKQKDFYALAPLSVAKATDICNKSSLSNLKDYDDYEAFDNYREIYLYFNADIKSEFWSEFLSGCGSEDGNCYQ